jgi:hypothetical protein
MNEVKAATYLSRDRQGPGPQNRFLMVAARIE